MSLKIHWLYPFSQKLFFVLLYLIFLYEFLSVFSWGPDGIAKEFEKHMLIPILCRSYKIHGLSIYYLNVCVE